jgi:hypothetical protein
MCSSMPLRSDFDSELDPPERELGERLEQDRPAPPAGFRGALGRRLAERDPGYGPRPRWLVPIVTASFSGGLALILLSALAAMGSL